ncbi:MAG: alpha-glucosidase C-terminal domain-containing protein [Bacteroidales bacterium]|nr:alpha-glucosidase C-terminal domain-containing protein [Bacteroidales bacterium]
MRLNLAPMATGIWKSIVTFTLFGLIVFSCTTASKSSLLQDETVGLVGITKLKPGENNIHLEDFFLQPEKIDSIRFSEENIFEFSPDKKTLSFVASDKWPVLTKLVCFIKGEAYTILLQKSRKLKHTLVFDPAGKHFEKVQVKGSMNDWNPANGKLDFADGKWQINLHLNPGKYHYQFVVDGEAILDPNNPVKEDNNIGGFNSVLMVGEDKTLERPHLQSTSYTEDEIYLASSTNSEEIIALWQNYELTGEQVQHKNDEIVIRIPREATKLKRSWIRLFSFNDGGLGNDLLIPLEYGKVVGSVGQLDRFDKETSILYFMMVDRFNNGNSDNDKKVDDPEVHERANYYGGDLAGIIQKLEEGYFEKLGINTIWLSPIVQNTWNAYTEFPEPHRKFTGYHGYWPISLNRIDKRFGTDEELHKLVGLAHEKGMNVILDFVSNHVHQESQLYQNHPEWVTPVDLPDGTKNIRLWDEQRLTTWFDTFLPTLDHEKPEVRNLVSDSALYWIEKFDLDGFRHDATKHIPEIYWQILTKKLRRQVVEKTGKRLYQVGETFGGRELIGSYVSSGMLDGQFDFNLYWDVRSVFVNDNEPFGKLNNSILETFDYYGCNHLMGNVSGNHDMPRFISFAGKALAFDEDSQEAGWSRDIKVEDPVGYKKLASMLAFTLTIPGVPVIYYGDEFGTPGAGDPDNRRPMRFDNLSEDELKTREITSKLVQLRKANLPLLFGDFNELLVTDDSYAYYRSYFGEVVLVAFNKNSEEIIIEVELPFEFKEGSLENQFGHEFSIDGNKLTITLPGNSFEVMSGITNE